MTPKRRELLNWFRTNALPLAAAFEGALRLLEDKTFPGRVHFIAHAVRDIADRLVFVLDPQQPPNRVQYENEFDWISSRWKDFRVIEGTSPSATNNEAISIDYEIAVRVQSLVTAHRERRSRSSAYELLFRYLVRNEPNHADVNRRNVSEFKAVRNWFMERTHLPSKAPPPVDEDELQSNFRKFETMLHSFVGNFFTGTSEIDEILRKANR